MEHEIKKICVITATRAEYGLLKNVIKEIQKDETLQLCLLVTGTHLSENYGYTVNEIVEDNIYIEQKIPIIEEVNSEKIDIAHTMSNALLKFSETFKRIKPHMVVVLGDRYELLSICEAAMICKIPIAHISGGEITEGAMDDTIRHCITKMSQLHFPGCEVYRQRIIQMGEQPDTVFNYGDVGIENIMNMQYMDIKELEDSIGISLKRPFACVTFHPETLEKISPVKQVEQLLLAVEQFHDLNFIFTGSNADEGGRQINKKIEQFVSEHDNCFYYSSLGIKRYLSLLRKSRMIIGNSSSGIVEAPSLGIPTINIGSRQKGRLQASSIINCKTNVAEIVNAINKANAKSFQQGAKNAENPYEKGNTSINIIREIKRFLDNGGTVVKKFYDLP